MMRIFFAILVVCSLCVLSCNTASTAPTVQKEKPETAKKTDLRSFYVEMYFASSGSYIKIDKVYSHPENMIVLAKVYPSPGDKVSSSYYLSKDSIGVEVPINTLRREVKCYILVTPGYETMASLKTRQRRLGPVSDYWLMTHFFISDVSQIKEKDLKLIYSRKSED